MNKLRVALCQGRHDIPQATDGSIFPSVVPDPTDINGLRNRAEMVLKDAESVDLYVTGLTVALVEVIKYCIDKDITLTLYHWNTATNDYYPQEVHIADNKCPWCDAIWHRGSWFCSNCGSSK